MPANIPNFSFASGTVFTPELADLAYEAPIFDGQTQYKGHRAKIDDSELSDTAGQVKDRLSVATSGLRPSQGSGLTVNYASGTVRLPGGTLLAINAGTIAVANNTTVLIWVNSTGAIETGVVAPSVRALIAQVTAVSGSITALQDLRFTGIQDIRPIASSIKVFGGSRIVDKTCTPGEVFDQGYYYFRNFTVPSGITITISKYAKIFCSGNVTIDGTVNVTAATPGVRSYSVLFFIGGLAYMPITGNGQSTGALAGTGTEPESYSYGASPLGSSGTSGFAVGGIASQSATFGASGDGGGCLWIEAAGTINVTGTINARGTNATAATATGSNVAVSGSGGGSGGLIYLSSLQSVTCTGTSVLDVRGGAGGAAQKGASVAERAWGGGGGGGGWIVLASPANNTTGATLSLTGGAAGANTTYTSGSEYGGGGGGAYGGFGGINYVGYGGTGGTGTFLSLAFSPVG